MYRDPKPEELKLPIFEAIWQVIKTWDINVPAEYAGYSGATGNHVCAILDAIEAERERVLGHERLAVTAALREAAGIEAKLGLLPSAVSHTILALIPPADRDALDAYVQQRVDEQTHWLHRQWHQSTGIPCDGTVEFCPVAAHRSKRAGEGVENDLVGESHDDMPNNPGADLE